MNAETLSLTGFQVVTGDSGSPMLNEKGVLVGVLRAKSLTEDGKPLEGGEATRGDRVRAVITDTWNENLTELSSPQQIDFANGSKTVYFANFSTWPTNSSEHGFVGPEKPNNSFTHYVLESTSGGVWMRPRQYASVTPSLQGDFIVDIGFKGVLVHSSLNVTLSDAGADYSQLDFYFAFGKWGPWQFSINENWVEKDSYVKLKNRIAEWELFPSDFSNREIEFPFFLSNY